MIGFRQCRNILRQSEDRFDKLSNYFDKGNNMNPKKKIDDFETILNALSDLPPETEFSGVTVAEYRAQVQKSRADRAHLIDLANQTTEGEDRREC